MQRYFIPNDQFNERKSVLIQGEDARHIQRVMRMQPGDQVICCNQNGEAFLTTLESLGETRVQAKIIEPLINITELPVKVTIAQALPKGEKLDFVIQKGTECGAHSFLLFSSERSVVKWNSNKIEKKLERMEKIAKEAAEQSHRNRIPAVFYFESLKQLVTESKLYNCKLIAYEEEAKAHKQKQLALTLSQIDPQDHILVLIGPEGGLSSKEVEELKEAGFVPCGLGPRILRTETASLYVLSAISYQLELLNEVN